ncbi:hypothetical protein RA272_27985, partial [Pseudomonas syringae pv. tagetis]
MGLFVGWVCCVFVCGGLCVCLFWGCFFVVFFVVVWFFGCGGVFGCVVLFFVFGGLVFGLCSFWGGVWLGSVWAVGWWGWCLGFGGVVVGCVVGGGELLCVVGVDLGVVFAGWLLVVGSRVVVGLCVAQVVVFA